MPQNDTNGRDVLKNVEEAGRTALAEMRRLLDAMRHDGDELELVPHPGLHDIDSLIDDVRAAGLEVRLRVKGDPVDLPPALDLSAYRIVQEALTNTLKHAKARYADVEVGYGSGQLAIEVRDDGSGPVTSNGLGHGLVGIGERVKIYGGEMSAGVAEPGGFVLRVHLPIDGR
jgi:signal transduction histidine kinase